MRLVLWIFFQKFSVDLFMRAEVLVDGNFICFVDVVPHDQFQAKMFYAPLRSSSWRSSSSDVFKTLLEVKGNHTISVLKIYSLVKEDVGKMWLFCVIFLPKVPINLWEDTSADTNFICFVDVVPHDQFQTKMFYAPLRSSSWRSSSSDVFKTLLEVKGNHTSVLKIYSLVKEGVGKMWLFCVIFLPKVPINLWEDTSADTNFICFLSKLFVKFISN